MGALPVLNWRQAAELAGKRKRRQRRRIGRKPTTQGRSKRTRHYRFVVPVLTWAADAVHPSLSLVCPRTEIQLDPRVHADIVRLLADQKTPGFAEDFVTFDENDVFDRLSAGGNQYFGGVADPKREFSEPEIAQAYLDLIKHALDENQLETEKEDALVSTLILPDVRGRPTAFTDLYASVSLPLRIPGLSFPPILDPDLVAHQLFKRKKWKRPKFTMAEFLESGALQAADEQTRRKFWRWLRRNERKIAPRIRPKLADLVIWPDENNRLCKMSDLCNPRSGRVGTVLASFIRRPHAQLRRSKLVSVGGQSRMSLRRAPSSDEVAHWLEARLARFKIGNQPDAATTDELHRFEADFSILYKDRVIATLLRAATVTLPALAQDGSIRLRKELVIPTVDNARLALPDRFMLNGRQHAAMLDKLSPALNAPSVAMLLDAFAEDSANIAALQPRLKEFIRVTDSNSDERRELAEKRIVPADGQLRAPCALTFTSNKGDYWGDWKIRISTKGLSQNDQNRYRDVGVTSALPKPETSRAFFGWLVNQDQKVLRQHIPCVLRHFLDSNGPVRWAPNFPATPCIPARNQDGLRLVSLRTARRQPVFLSDAGNIGDVIVQSDGAVLLVIHQAKEVAAPISEPLRELGIRSLREALTEPESVAGTGRVAPVSEDVIARFSRLGVSRFQRTFRKRLNELGVQSELVRHDWHDRLGRIRKISLANKVEARYRFRRNAYRLDVDTGFDRETGVFWMKRELDARRLYESLAKHFVFKPTARPIHFLALEHAVELDISDPSFGRPAGFEANANDDETVAEDADRLGRNGDKNNALGEARGGHFPFTPDPERNRPKPGPISNEPERSPRRSKGQSGSRGSGGGSRQTPDLETKHIEELKRDHYASHCQMCLCQRPPQELAPVGVNPIDWTI